MTITHDELIELSNWCKDPKSNRIKIFVKSLIEDFHKIDIKYKTQKEILEDITGHRDQAVEWGTKALETTSSLREYITFLKAIINEKNILIAKRNSIIDEFCPDQAPEMKEHIHQYITGNPNCIICIAKMISLPKEGEKIHGR